jgi:hypothetical protein
MWECESRIQDAAIADLHGTVPVSERHIVGADSRKLTIADQPRRAQMGAAIGLWRIVPMPQRDLPTRTPGPRRLERDHIAIVEMRTSPDFQVEIGKNHRLRMAYPEHVQIFDLGQRSIMKHGIVHGRIVIARQHDHRQAGGGNHLGGAVEQCVGQPVTVEGIAGQDDGIRLRAPRRREY